MANIDQYFKINKNYNMDLASYFHNPIKNNSCGKTLPNIDNKYLKVKNSSTQSIRAQDYNYNSLFRNKDFEKSFKKCERIIFKQRENVAKDIYLDKFIESYTNIKPKELGKKSNYRTSFSFLSEKANLEKRIIKLRSFIYQSNTLFSSTQKISQNRNRLAETIHTLENKIIFIKKRLGNINKLSLHKGNLLKIYKSDKIIYT